MTTNQTSNGSESQGSSNLEKRLPATGHQGGPRERADDARPGREHTPASPEANLFEQRGFPRAVFDAIPNPLMVIDSSLRVRLVNEHMKRQFAGGAEALLLPRPGEVLRCRDAFEHPEGECGSRASCGECQIRRPTLEALAGTRVHRRLCEFDVVDKGRPRRLALQVSATPFEHQGTHLAVMILEDVTELETLRRRHDSGVSFAGIVGASPAMQTIFDLIREVADLDVPVLIQGESGTGKELVARAIHFEGARARERFVPVNCGAIPDGLLESELFGHVKGAFTGAVRTRKGRFELADRGTIFLDEIGDLGPAMQVKLLRVLQEGTIDPVGAEKGIRVDVRVLSATNKDLSQEVAAGRFREDLYYRLCVMPITVPPLRERLVDLPLIAEHLLSRGEVSPSGTPPSLSSAALAALLEQPWPGNVRELHNALQYAAIKSRGGLIMPEHLPPEIRARGRLSLALSQERPQLSGERVAEALKSTGGNRSEAAKVLGVSRATLYRYLDRLAEPNTEAP